MLYQAGVNTVLAGEAWWNLSNHIKLLKNPDIQNTIYAGLSAGINL